MKTIISMSTKNDTQVLFTSEIVNTPAFKKILSLTKKLKGIEADYKDRINAEYAKLGKRNALIAKGLVKDKLDRIK